MDDIVTSRRLRSALPVFVTLAGFLLALTIAAMLYLGREVFVPLAIAVLLAFALAPVARALQAWGVPRGAAASGVVVAAFVGLGLLFWLIVVQTTELAATLPQHKATLVAKIEAVVGGGGASKGSFGRAVDAIQDIGRELTKPDGGVTPPAPAAPAPGSGARPAASQAPVPVIVLPSPTGALEQVGDLLKPLLYPLAKTFIVLVFTIFILAQREDLRNRLIRIAGADDIQKTTVAIDDAAVRMSKLLLSQLALNAAFGLAVGLGLWVIGLPSPILWGILAGVMRFVPYVGIAISASLPIGLAIAIDPGWSLALWTAVYFLFVDIFAAYVIEPLLYGHSTGMSPAAVVGSATVWTFLWGPVGLLLAAPLTVCLIVLGRHIPRLAFLDVLLGDRPALTPQQIFYQRMLAGDPVEAVDQAKDFLAERELATYYDEVALAGLRLAQADVARGAITVDRQTVMRESVEKLVASLKSTPAGATDVEAPDATGGLLRRPRARGRRVLGAEAAAAAEAVGPDRPVARLVRRRQDLHPDWRGDTPVVVVAGQGPLDSGVASMLAQLFERQGLRAQIVDQAFVASDEPLPDNGNGVALVCFSYLDALSTVHIRYAARRMRRKARGCRTIVGLWRERDPRAVADLRRATSADRLVTTFQDALEAAKELSSQPLRSPGVGITTPIGASPAGANPVIAAA